jgi:hypothetical protein
MHHATTEHKCAADSGTHRNGDDIPVAPACTEPHLSSQDRVYIVVAYDGARKPVAEPCGERNTFKELQLAFEPDNPARRGINPAWTSDADCRDLD